MWRWRCGSVGCTQEWRRPTGSMWREFKELAEGQESRKTVHGGGGGGVEELEKVMFLLWSEVDVSSEFQPSWALWHLKDLGL